MHLFEELDKASCLNSDSQRELTGAFDQVLRDPHVISQWVPM